jgi:Protein kinase domain
VPADAAFCSACGAATPTAVDDGFGGEFDARVRAELPDRYRIERELGRGGMAVVFLATDVRHDRSVAIKVFRPDLAASIGPERFLREIKLAARLNHPHILALHDSGATGPAGDAPGLFYYVMPYVDGESLRARLQRERQLPLDEAIDLTRQVAAGLDYAHQQGVIHRDVKPENILLARGHALIADFGIAKAISREGATHLTSAGTSLGTPLYMSPEQAVADPAMDGRTDVYSLGCVLYEMLAGEPPFTGTTAHAILAKHAVDPRPSVRTLRDTVPDAVDAALHRAMAKVPADRFGTAAAFVADLRVPGTPPALDARGMEGAEREDVAASDAVAQPAPARPVARFRLALFGAVAVAAVGILVDLLEGGGMGVGPLAVVVALLGAGLEYGRLRQAGAGWRDVVGLGRSPAEGAPGGGTEAWVSGEQEFGHRAADVRRARGHRAAIVGLMAQLPRSEREALAGVMPAVDQLVLEIAGAARSLRQVATPPAALDTATDRHEREQRRLDLEGDCARALARLESLRDELRQVGRHGLSAAGPTLTANGQRPTAH